jgi:hypothetical protein
MVSGIARAIERTTNLKIFSHNLWLFEPCKKLEKNYASALDNYGQSCFVGSDFQKNEVCLKDTNDAPRLTIKILWTCTPPLCV